MKEESEICERHVIFMITFVKALEENLFKL